MPDTPPTSNAKIYPRPERKAPSPLLLAVSLIVLMLITVVAFRAFANRNATPNAQAAAPAESGSQQREMPLVDKRR